MKESYKPIPHHPPIGFVHSSKFYLRLLVDFQQNTIFRDLKKILPGWEGQTLDVGCGNSPFKFLIDKSKANYVGIDIEESGNFDYYNQEKIVFDGENIPFENESFENIMSTEVLEHIENSEKIIDEMYRVMKHGGHGVVTIPWSARVHFAPYDFCRYTPFKLEKLFSKFQSVKIFNRGTDINSIVSKMIVVFFYNLINILTFEKFKWINIILIPLKIMFLIFFSPILVLVIGISHLELFLKFGSKSDPLGYTILLNKY